MIDDVPRPQDMRLTYVTALLWLVACAGCTPAPSSQEATQAVPRPLGEFRLLGDPSPCEGQLCYEFEVQCPEVSEPERGLLTVDVVEGSPRGVVLLASGGFGTYPYQLWPNGTPSLPQARIIRALHEAGLGTVQLSWENGWPIGSSQGAEGLTRLACRPATVAQWVKEHLVKSDQAFCAAGSSGGAMQISYMLTHYGLEDSISLAVPYGGHWSGRVDEGCLGSDPLEAAMHYRDDARSFIDSSFGFPASASGPCSSRDESWREAFKDSSVSVGGDYYYPNTLVWLVVGGGDKSGALRQGLTYYDSLLRSGSPSVRLDIIPNAPHTLVQTPEGEAMIRDILIGECRPHNAG
jgi:hypothetical protein